jgi:hypothetical protein
MDADLQAYIDGIAPEFRPLFDRLHGIMLRAHPDAAFVYAYNMPTYRMGKRRLHLAVWRHGISIYGWSRDDDGGFSKRHPDLLSGKSTLRIRPEDAAGISDREFEGLLGGAFEH